MTAFTPGPWTIGLKEGSNHPEGYAIGITSDDGSDFYPVAYMETKNAEANARLIAAAPDLLTALEKIAKGEGAFSRDPLEHCSNTIDDMKAIARAAITKARNTEEEATPKIHFHVADRRFCGTQDADRRFTYNLDEITCPACKARNQ